MGSFDPANNGTLFALSVFNTRTTDLEISRL